MDVVLAILFVVGLWGFIIWALLRGNARAKLVMLPDEVRVAGISAHCTDMRYGGFRLVGTPHDGKLILTNLRLIHTDVREKKVGLVLLRNHIIQIAKGSKGPLMTLELDYQTANMTKPKHSRFLQMSSMSVVDARQQLPIGMFIDKLLAWKQVA